MTNPIVEYYNRFVDLPPEEVKIIEQNSRIVKIKKKEIIHNQNDVTTSSALVLKGCLRIYSTDKSGNEFNHYFAFEDWWIGEPYQLFNDLPSANSVQALEDCELMLLDKASFIKIMNNCPVYSRTTHILSNKGYSKLLERGREKMTKNAKDIYVDLLKRHPNITKRISIKHIASYIGIKPDSLSRIRREIART